MDEFNLNTCELQTFPTLTGRERRVLLCSFAAAACLIAALLMGSAINRQAPPSQVAQAEILTGP